VAEALVSARPNPDRSPFVAVKESAMPTSPNTISTLIFDIDGTLVDSVDLHARAWHEAFAHFGFQLRVEDIRAQIGKGGDLVIAAFVPEPQLERLQEPLANFRHELFLRKYLPQVKGLPGVRALFRRLLDDGRRVALATSAKADELKRLEELAGIADLPVVATSSEDAPRSKPHPDIIEAVLARLGWPPRETCVVIGDSPYDAEAARHAGLHAIGVRSGGFEDSALWAAGCVAIYDDVTAILQAYEQHGELAFIHDPVLDEIVDEAVDESFPASDPPSWTLGVEPHARSGA
jgi:HAD superfamily hydrolase (TIGR01509 family)